MYKRLKEEPDKLFIYNFQGYSYMYDPAIISKEWLKTKKITSPKSH